MDNSLLQTFAKTKQQIEPGEELLHKVYNFGVAPGRTARVIAAVDCGSTQTRQLMLDREEVEDFMDHLGKVYVIPSESVTVLDDRVLPNKGASLWDNMESSITNSSEVQDVIFRHVRLARGTKALDVESTENRLGSSTQKTSDATYYYNLIESIGISAMLKYGDQIPTKLLVTLGASLPPDDLVEVNLNRFKDNLRRYTWKHKPTGVEIDIVFEAVHVMTEPEAYIKAYYTLQQKEEPEYVMHLEAGGRSIGVEILRYGKTVDGASVTIEFGATQLLQQINDLYIKKYGGKPIRRERLEEAVRTGMLRIGNDTKNIVDIIKQAKAEMAKRVSTQVVQKVFDSQSKVSMTDLNTISVSGRFFDEGDYKASVALYLKENFKQLSPTTDFEHYKGSYIPQGLLLDTLIEHVFNT